MKKFALIGKNIKHSRSPAIYKEIIPIEFSYDLIDIMDAKQLPSIEDLSAAYCGINITSPYKEHYFNRALSVDVPLSLSAINCISFFDNSVKMTNTDYIAVRWLLLNGAFSKFNVERYCILGDGVMSHLIQSVLIEMKRPFVVISRRKHGDLNLYDYSQLMPDADKFTLLINTCAREFTFTAHLQKQFIFWDMNYDMSHQIHLAKTCHYVDGYDLLYEQAKGAARFWNVIA